MSLLDNALDFLENSWNSASDAVTKSTDYLSNEWSKQVENLKKKARETGWRRRRQLPRAARTRTS